MPPDCVFSCCDFSGSLHTAQIPGKEFILTPFLALPAVKLMTLHLQLLHPLLFCFWPMRAPLWQTDLRKKCFLSLKNIIFFNFRRTDFPKAPLCGFKSTPFICLSAFFAPWASARQWSRMRRLGKIVLLSFPIPSLVVGLPTIDFMVLFLILRQNVVPA